MEQKRAIVIPEERIEELRSRFLGKDLMEVLTAPTPKDWIETRPIRGGGSVEYIPGSYFIQRLNDVFGFLWSFEALEQFERDGYVVVKGKLTVRIPGRMVSKEFPNGTKETIKFDEVEISKVQYGGSEVKRFAQDVVDRKGRVTYKAGTIMDLGDDYKSAATDALKKCGTLLGMFFDIYGPREKLEEGKTTSQQLEAFYMRAQKAGMDEGQARVWCEGQVGRKPEEADPLALMGLVPRLVDLAKKVA